MPLELKKILADATNYADELELPFKDGTVRLGDLRAEIGARDRTLTEITTERDGWKERAGTFENTLRTMQTQQNSNDNQNADQNDQGFDWQRTAGGGGDRDVTRGAPSEYDYSDAYSQGLTRRIGQMTQAELKKLTANMGEQQKQFVQALAASTNMLLRQQSKLDFKDYNDWPEGYNPTRAFKEAMEKGYVDRETGLPNIHVLHDEVTRPTRHAKEIDEAVKKAVEKARGEWQNEQAESRKSRFNVVPGGNRSRPSTTGDRGKAQPQTRDLGQFVREMPLTDEDIGAAATLFGGAFGGR